MTGFICLDKAEGETSFFAIAKLRRICGEKKAGHTGTLDPMATGVLPVALGGASRYIPLLPSCGKAYIARFRLGIITDTLDITGIVLNERPVLLGKGELLHVLENFKGAVKQVPPMYSALKHGGQRLYTLARQGIEVEREEREIFIEELSLTGDLGGNEYEIRVGCSKGTYIRTLVADIGEALGCGAVMTALRRTMSDGFLLEDSRTIEDIEKYSPETFLIPVDKALGAYPAVFVSGAQAARFKNGGGFDAERLRGLGEKGLYRVYNNENIFLGVGEWVENELAPKRVMNYEL